MTRKKVLMLLGSVFLALMLVLPLVAACAAPTPTPTPSPTPTPTPTPEVIVWHYHTHGSSVSLSTLPVIWWGEEIEKRTGGRWKLELHYSSTLLPAKEAPEGLRDNIAQMAYIAPPYFPSKLPLSDGLFIPAVTFGLDREAALKWQTEYFASPYLVDELDRWNIKFLAPLAMAGYQLIGNTPIRKVDDLKGVKIRAVSWSGKLIEKLGGTPVSVLYSDVYSALDTGLIDMMASGPDYSYSYKWSEVSKYFINDFNLISIHAGQFYAVNKDAWNALPKDIQDIIIETTPEFLNKSGEVQGGAALEGIEHFKQLDTEGKMEFIDFPIEEQLKMKKLAEEEVWPEWVEYWEAKGYPAQEALDTAVRLRDKYAK